MGAKSAIQSLMDAQESGLPRNASPGKTRYETIIPWVKYSEGGKQSRPTEKKLQEKKDITCGEGCPGTWHRTLDAARTRSGMETKPE